MNQLSPQGSACPALLSPTIRFVAHATAAVLLALLLSSKARALGQAPYVETDLKQGNFVIAHAKLATPVYVDPTDYPGVIRAVGDLQSDIHKVSGPLPSLIRDIGSTASSTNRRATSPRSPGNGNPSSSKPSPIPCRAFRVP